MAPVPPTAPLRRLYQLVIINCLFVLLAACGSAPREFSMTLLHLNDTHSHLEPTAVTLQVDGMPTTVQLGGAARLQTLVRQMRAEDPDLLLLHGGDAVQGTLYFSLFNGSVEYTFLSLLGVDAMTFGNHEFDRGIAPIPGWITGSAFPWLSANIDFSLEPAVAPLVRPYMIRDIRGEQVAVIGLTTETTPLVTRDVGNAIFRDAVQSAREQVAALTGRGINKIILLSHLGYAMDKQLAEQVAGIDIIVGGHSHTLLGEPQQLGQLGLIPEGSSPTELRGADGKRVLVLQAWQWGNLLGNLRVTFTADGEVIRYSSAAVIPAGDRFSRSGMMLNPGTQPYADVVTALERTGIVRIVPEDAAAAELLAPYAAQVAAYRTVTVAQAAEPLVRGLNSGPGPLVADSMLAAAPRTRVALMNYGGVRKDLAAGNITAGDVMEVLPFAGTLVLVDLTGAELKNALEEGIDFLKTRYPDQPCYPYVGGISFSVRPSAARGERISGLMVRDEQGVYRPVEDAASYRTVVNAFIAGGGDGFTTIKNAAGYRYDTGIIDSDALRSHLAALGTVHNPTEQRISVLQTLSRTVPRLFGIADTWWAPARRSAG